MKIRSYIGIVLLFLVAETSFGYVTADELPVVSSDTEALDNSARNEKLSIPQAVVLGLIEGATEYLPVSSTGHLLIYQHAAGISEAGGDSRASDALAICIQSGAILAVVMLYFGRLRQIVQGVLGGNPEGLRLLGLLIVAFFPAAVVGLLFNDWIRQHLFGIPAVAAALFTGGLLILAVAGRLNASTPGKELHEISWTGALKIGTLQCLAFWPGFSRSLAAILGCRWAGMKLSAAVEFSFLLGLVTLSAATAYEGLKHGSEMIEQYGYVAPAVALVTAFLSAVISVRFMVTLLNRRGLAPFGYYRIILAALCVVLIFLR